MANGIEEKKSSVSGGLLMSKDQAMIAAETLRKLWDGGECRLLEDFLEKLKSNVYEARAALDEIEGWIAQFDKIKLRRKVSPAEPAG